MILVDTSVWIDHLRNGVEPLANALQKNQVCIHPMIIGELACGHLKNRDQLIKHWNRLPRVTCASHDEVMQLIENAKLMGRGIGYVDAHLLAAAKLHSAQLFTLDKRLAALSEKLGVATQHF